MEVRGAKVPKKYWNIIQKHFALCSAEERNSYRFATNDDRIEIFGWSIPLTKVRHVYSEMLFCIPQ